MSDIMVTFDVGAANSKCNITDEQAKELIYSLSDETLLSLEHYRRYLIRTPDFTLEFYKYDGAHPADLKGVFLVTNVFSNEDVFTLD